MEVALEQEGKGMAYDLMDQLASQTPAGADGLFLLPFFEGLEILIMITMAVQFCMV